MTHGRRNSDVVKGNAMNNERQQEESREGIDR